MRNVLLFAIITGLCLSMVDVDPATAAETFDDCRLAASAERRLAACTAVIGSPNAAAEQKAVAYRNRGRVRTEAGAFDQAMDDLTEAIRLAPGDLQAYLYRAQARTARGDLDRAIGDYGEVIRLRPNGAIGYIGRGHAELTKGDPRRAIADFTEAIRLQPSNASAHNNRGLAWRAAGDLLRAVDDYTIAIGLNPLYGLAYNNRGYAYEAAGDTARAILDFERALLVDPSLTGAKEGLARLGAKSAFATDSARLVAEGRALVEQHCRACHNIERNGESTHAKAPPFRWLHRLHPIQSLREPLTRGIAAPHDEMPKFRIPDADVDKIIAYVNSLGQADGHRQ